MNVISGVGYLSSLFAGGNASATQQATKATGPSFGSVLGLQVGRRAADATPALSPSSTQQATAKPATAAEEFRAFMAMTPAEKIRYSMLQEMGLTEDDVKAMPPEQQQKIEEAIAERIQQQAQANALAGATQSIGATAANAAAQLFQTIQAGSAAQPPHLDLYS